MPFCRHVLDTRPKPADSPQLLILFLHSKKNAPYRLPFGSSFMTTHSHHRTQCSQPRRSMHRRCLQPTAPAARAPAPLPVHHRRHTPSLRNLDTTPSPSPAVSPRPSLPTSPSRPARSSPSASSSLCSAYGRQQASSPGRPGHLPSRACCRLHQLPRPSRGTRLRSRILAADFSYIKFSIFSSYFSIQILREWKHIYI
jgi:hypothetical protein